MNKKRDKKGKLQNNIAVFVMMLFMMACGAFGGYFFAKLNKQYLKDADADLGETLIVIGTIFVLLAIVTYLHMYVHETGHLIFGLLSGYKFQSIRFGSLMLVKTENGIKICKYTLAGTGGQCLMLPPDTSGNDYPVALYNWGGCIANLILALVGFIVYFCIGKITTISLIFMFIGIVGVGSALVNGIPFSALSNDGYNAGILKKDVKARKAFKNQLKINNYLTQGKGIKSMPSEWFEWNEEIPENNLDASAGVMRFGYLIEFEKYDEAKQLGNFLLDNAPSIAKVHESVIKAELIYCDIMLGEDKEQIKQSWKTNKKDILLLKAMPSIQRILYGYYKAVENDDKKAAIALDTFEKLAKKYPYQVEIASERVMIEKIDFIEAKKEAV